MRKAEAARDRSAAEAKMQVLNLALEKQKEETAKAQLELLRGALPRISKFNRANFLKQLEGKPPGKVELVYQRDDVDAYLLGGTIKDLLTKAGWETAGPRPAQEADALDQKYDEPLILRAGGGLGGMALVTKEERLVSGPAMHTDPEHNFCMAFAAAELTEERKGALSLVFQKAYDPRMAEGWTRFIIGPKWEEYWEAR